MVAEAATASPQPVEPPRDWHQPIRSGEYTDDTGARWQLRGGDLSWKSVERLIRDPQVRVLHTYLNEGRDVTLEHRDSFTAMIRPYLDGKQGDAVNDHTDFRAAEFLDERRRSLLIVEETC